MTKEVILAKPRILFLDCESLPNICYAYDLFSYKSYKMIIKEKTLITFAWKFLGDKEVQVIKGKPYDDKAICVKIGELMKEADYVVAHYGDKFDLKFIRSRTMLNNLPAPAPVASIDTYKLGKKYFNFNANRLDYLGKLFGLGEKLPTSFELWAKCAEGNKKAIQEMADYNKQDVALLEKVFLYMLPHVNSNLNHNLFSDNEEHVCHNCGSTKLQKRGTIVTKLSKKQRVNCQSCGAWGAVKYEG